MACTKAAIARGQSDAFGIHCTWRHGPIDASSLTLLGRAPPGGTVIWAGADLGWGGRGLTDRKSVV